MCQSVSARLLSSSSSTARPPAWMQKCSNASLKSGMYGFTFFILSSFLAASVAMNSSCSDSGSTSGPSVVMLVLSASPATAIRSLDSDTPTRPPPSSSCVTHPKHRSSAPLCVRTVCTSSYLARRRSARRLESSTAAPPIRNRQLDTSFDRSLPEYQLSVMFSVLITSAYDPGCVCSRSLARSMESSPALHPMPPRL
uniref:Uncharacterized protein n=1 Tax=Arundo donax TaxID=35708 RepID=A0A0A9F9A5_ARUDO